ncbi:hypothetical protein GC170_03520 [bacterium]|nr:hypothetical protein [bacterium]
MLRSMRLLAMEFAGLMLVMTLTMSAPANAIAATWKVGVAKTVITPDTPVWLAGYGSKRVPDGKLHDLWAKALAFEAADGTRAVLITSDFQGVPKSMSDRVFAAVRDKFGLDRSRIMLTFSHNHCGPRLGDDLIDYYPVEAEQERVVEAYTSKMVEACVRLVGDALADLAPATVETSEGRCTFAVNRRENPEPEVPDMIAKGVPLKGPVDHSVPVMKVSRPDGSTKAILFGYACHPTTLSFTTYCGDYPGFAQIEIEKHHPGATALFVNTCGGDQNPLPRRQVALCEKYGKMLAEGVEGALAKPGRAIEPKLAVAFEMVDLPYLEPVTDATLEKALADPNAIKSRWAKRLLEKRKAGANFESAYPYPLHAWLLGGDTLMIGMGAETVVDYALRFKREYGQRTWVLGYADDMISYIPSRRVWEEGRYEGGSFLYEYGRPAFRWAGDIEDRIAAGIDRLTRKVGHARHEP